MLTLHNNIKKYKNGINMLVKLFNVILKQDYNEFLIQY